MILQNLIHKLSLLVLLLSAVLAACTEKDTTPVAEKPARSTLFTLLPSSQTGVDFNNTIFESDSLNILKEAYLYNGAGVGIGDFNKDGFADIYFAANMVSNKLYLNQGNDTEGSLAFDDVTQAAGVTGDGKWCTGVSVVDINADGWLDIYVSATFHKDPDRRRNLLYINQGVNGDGIPVFKESAEAYGLADSGYSTQSVFFDYDRDGDLDVYVLTNVLDAKQSPIAFRTKVTDGSALNNDRLYRNDGNGTFTDVSRQAGILIEGYGHAVSVTDFNLDGWPDLYVSNDFIANDVLYLNNQHGKFTNHVRDYIKHMGWSVMGTDVVDINNDALVDIIALEMLPENNLRKKVNLSGNNYITYINAGKFDYEHQYIRNVLQLNRGMTPEGHPMFSEVAYLAGVYQTDWSWTPLVADFDNDGFRDMVITNGYPRDVTDMDYAVYDNGQSGFVENTSLAMADSFPVVKIANYAFKNTGGFLFADSTQAWGLNQPSFSHGGAYADLDNDGDLDLVVNNMNDKAFIYQNTSNDPTQQNRQHYLSVAFQGSEKNTQGIGARVYLYYAGGRQQYYEHQPTRGYLSTVDGRAHFGLSDATQIDSLLVQWPDSKRQQLTRIKADQTLVLSYQEATETDKPALPPKENPLLAEAATRYGLTFKHEEREAIDYNIQRTLPHKFSQYGPGIAVGDVDGNGYDDLYIGGSAGKPGVFFMQDTRGKFSKDTHRLLGQDDAEGEDMDVLLFDADNDADLDLYVVRGSYEFRPEHPASQDRLYLNNGKGKFEQNSAALPQEFSNGSCVRAADFDQDGDLDLFVGGRVVSGSYPVAPESYLLENQGGQFVDVTRQYCPTLQHLGMISDALWSDFDQDGKVDLILTGEWMPVTFLKNAGSTFVAVNTGISEHTGWWNSLASGDFDNDGDTDYVAGNLGLNANFKASIQEPMTLYAKDLDENGKIDPMIFCYLKAEDGTRKPFPMHTRDDLIGQLTAIRRRYPTYQSFGGATMDALWSAQDRENALMLQATDLATSYIENKGKGQFSIRPLPVEAQLAPVYGMVSDDVDGDGNLDLLLVGNDYGMEPFSGRHDAFMGLCLKGDGAGNFQSMSIAESGFFVPGDGKALATVHTAQGEDLWLATQNQDSLKVFRRIQGTDAADWIDLEAGDLCADILYKDNHKRHTEFYYGSTFLSQSSRKMMVDQKATHITITDFSGNKREITPKPTL